MSLSKMKKILVGLLACIVALTAYAAVPPSYYTLYPTDSMLIFRTKINTNFTRTRTAFTELTNTVAGMQPADPQLDEWANVSTSEYWKSAYISSTYLPKSATNGWVTSTHSGLVTTANTNGWETSSHNGFANTNNAHIWLGSQTFNQGITVSNNIYLSSTEHELGIYAIETDLFGLLIDSLTGVMISTTNVVPSPSDTLDLGGYSTTLMRWRNIYGSNIVVDAVTLDNVTVTNWNSFILRSETNSWTVSSHANLVTTNMTNAWVTSTHAGLVTTANTNGWVTSTHTGLVTAASTNGWETGSHSNLLLSSATNAFVTKTMTNAWETGSHITFARTNVSNRFAQPQYIPTIYSTSGYIVYPTVTSTTYKALSYWGEPGLYVLWLRTNSGSWPSSLLWTTNNITPLYSNAVDLGGTGYYDGQNYRFRNIYGSNLVSSALHSTNIFSGNAGTTNAITPSGLVNISTVFLRPGNTNGWETSTHSGLVTTANTNGWETGSHSGFPKTNVVNRFSTEQFFTDTITVTGRYPLVMIKTTNTYTGMLEFNLQEWYRAGESKAALSSLGDLTLHGGLTVGPAASVYLESTPLYSENGTNLLYGLNNILLDIYTNGWVTSSHSSFVTQSQTNGWVTSSHSSFVTQSQTNGWVTSSHTGLNYVTPAQTNGWITGSHASLVTQAQTNGWVTSSHSGFVTDGSTLTLGLRGPDSTTTNGYVTFQQAKNLTSANATLFLKNSTASVDLAPYKLLDITPGTNAASDVVYSSVTNNQYLGGYVTSSNVPGITQMQAGTYHVITWLQKGATGAGKVKIEGYLVAQNGTIKYEVSDTEYSPLLTTTMTQYELDIVLGTNITTLITDRWLLRPKINVTSGAPTVTIRTEGGYQSYLTGNIGTATEVDPIAMGYLTSHTNGTGSSVHGLGSIATSNNTAYVHTSKTNGWVTSTHSGLGYVTPAQTNGWITSTHSGLVTTANTNGWITSTHSGLGYVTPAQTNGWVTSTHSGLVTTANTNGWVTSTHSGLVTTANTNGWITSSHTGLGYVTPAQTNGWITSTHSGLVTTANTNGWVTSTHSGLSQVGHQQALSTITNAGTAAGYNVGESVGSIRTVKAPTTITYSGTNVTTDASLNCTFRVTLTNSPTLNLPSNLVDGQIVRWWVKQGTGTNRLWCTGAFRYPSSVTNLVLSTAKDAKDLVIGEYDGASSTVRFTGLLKYDQ